MADGNYIEVADDSEMGFHYEFPNVDMTCSVVGVLVWNDATRQWDLHKDAR